VYIIDINTLTAILYFQHDQNFPPKDDLGWEQRFLSVPLNKNSWNHSTDKSQFSLHTYISRQNIEYCLWNRYIPNFINIHNRIRKHNLTVVDLYTLSSTVNNWVARILCHCGLLVRDAVFSYINAHLLIYSMGKKLRLFVNQRPLVAL